MVKVYIKTFGCAHNISDSEFMAGELESKGYIVTRERDKADIVLVNSCSVKDPSQKRFLNEIRDSKRPVVLAGCVPQGDLQAYKDYPIIGVRNIHKVAEIVESALNGNAKQAMSMDKNPPLNISKKRVNSLVEIIPVSTGCLGNCTYCKTKQARGDLISYPEEEILKRIKTGIDKGACEIWLTSEDTGAYGLDLKDKDNKKKSIISLLYSIIDINKTRSKNALSKERYFKVRIGMTNPQWVKMYINDIINVFNSSDIFYRFLHIPVQSGSDKVLRDMRRGYSVDDFKLIVEQLRNKVKGITISTDIIVGYPTESEEDFEETMKLVRRYRFPVLNISKFYARPGTDAAKLKPLPSQVVKERSARLSRLYDSYNLNKECVGQTIKAYFSNKKKGTFIGKTDSYVEVIARSKENLLGKTRDVRVVEARKHCLIGDAKD